MSFACQTETLPSSKQVGTAICDRLLLETAHTKNHSAKLRPSASAGITFSMLLAQCRTTAKRLITTMCSFLNPYAPDCLRLEANMATCIALDARRVGV